MLECAATFFLRLTMLAPKLCLTLSKDLFSENAAFIELEHEISMPILGELLDGHVKHDLVRYRIYEVVNTPTTQFSQKLLAKRRYLIVEAEFHTDINYTPCRKQYERLKIREGFI